MVDKSKTIKILTKAIFEKKCAAIHCKDRSKVIAIEPHVLYTDSNEDIVLEFFQKSDNGDEDGTWNTVIWRDIQAAFLLNTSFSPRTKEGFSPKLDKYQAGLLAIVGSNFSPRKNRLVWNNIESTLEQLVRRDTYSQFANR